MVDRLYSKILNILKKDKECCTQTEIRRKLRKDVDRAILLGYLRCMVDTGKIKSKQTGKAKGYFIK
jgi:predicted transcriptional regulator